MNAKVAVLSHWNAEPCGTRGYSSNPRFDQIERDRYTHEPHIPRFANFDAGHRKRVLEIGVGSGTDFVQWVRRGAFAVGLDLSPIAVDLTRTRLDREGLQAQVLCADAEHLPFAARSFDIVYSYGVLHHTPNIRRALSEVYRVLKPGGSAKLMLYGLPSWTGWMLWTIHGLGQGKPWHSPRQIIHHHLESPGTQAFRPREVRELLAAFSTVRIERALLAGDLLLQPPSARYQARWHAWAWHRYPRRLIRTYGQGWGHGLLIEACK